MKNETKELIMKRLEKELDWTQFFLKCAKQNRNFDNLASSIKLATKVQSDTEIEILSTVEKQLKRVMKDIALLMEE